MSNLFNRLTRSKHNFNPNEPIPPKSTLHPNLHSKANSTTSTSSSSNLSTFFARSKSASSFKKLARSTSGNKDKFDTVKNSNNNKKQQKSGADNLNIFEPSLETQASNLQPDILRVYLKQNNNNADDSQQFTNYKSLQLLIKY